MRTDFAGRSSWMIRAVACVCVLGALCHLDPQPVWAQHTKADTSTGAGQPRALEDRDAVINGKWLLHGDGITLAYDPSAGCAMLIGAEGEPLIGRIAFDGDATATVTRTQAMVRGLGECSSLSLVRENGTRDEIMVSPALPFALFRRTVCNTSDQPDHIRSLPLLSCEASWAADGRPLKTMGTGGLLSVEENPGSHLWLAVAEPVNRRGLVCGWLTSDRGGGVVLSHRTNGAVRVSAHIHYGRLIIPPGKEEVSEVLALGWFKDARLGMEAWADTVAKVYGIHLPPQPVGYCSWNDGHEHVSEQHVALRASQAAMHLKPFGFSVIQIDDGWQRGMPGWIGNPRGPFPSGMRVTSDRIRSFGLVPGIWFCPFSSSGVETQGLISDPPNPGWYAPGLDLTNPKAIQHVKDVVTRVTQEYGFSYFKLDAFSIGLIDDGYDNQGWLSPRAFSYQPPNEAYWKKGTWRKVHDPLMTPFQAHRAGLKALREAAGEEAFVLGCNMAQSMSLYGASIGVVDAMRIGMDNNMHNYPEVLEEALTRIVDKDNNQIAHLLHGPIAGSRHYHLNRRIWYNDPDQAGDNVPLLSWTALSDSLWMVGDALDFGETPGESPVADRYQKTIPNHGKTTRPVDLFETALPRVWIVTDGEGAHRRDVVGFFNWNPDGENITIAESLQRLDMPADLTYAAYDFWENRFVGLFDKTVAVTLAPRSCSVLALRACRGYPIVLSTSRHVTQGMIDVFHEHWEPSTRTLAATSRVVGRCPYELRIYAPVGICGKALNVSVADEDRTAGVVASLDHADDVVRVSITSQGSREVRWSVQFGE